MRSSARTCSPVGNASLRALLTRFQAWADAGDGFIALVRTPPAQSDVPTRDAIGDGPVDAFYASLEGAQWTAIWPSEGVTSSSGSRVIMAGDDDEVDDDDAHEDDHALRLADRDELAALLDRVGVPEPGASRVVKDATWGIILEPGEGQSRLGGRPVLAVGNLSCRDLRRMTKSSAIAARGRRQPSSSNSRS
jgi:hypothetical protein